MKLTKLLNLAFVCIFIMGFSTSCMKKTTNKKSSTEDDGFFNVGGGGGTLPPPGGGTNPGDPPNTGTNPGCYEPGVGTQILDYFNHTIIAHGRGAQGVNWSSADDPSLQTPGYQDMFRTDGQFRVRVLALASPGTGDDNYGIDCFDQVPYGKLQVEVGLKYPGAYGYIDTHVFNDIAIDSCSETATFSLPSGYNVPLTLEVRDVKWNYTCDVYYGCSDPNKDCSNIPQYCPWDYVWAPDCFEIVLQWDTDQTKDIP